LQQVLLVGLVRQALPQLGIRLKQRELVQGLGLSAKVAVLWVLASLSERWLTQREQEVLLVH
jgi:hypothetical protein